LVLNSGHHNSPAIKPALRRAKGVLHAKFVC
jgi:hypothetical protein